MRAYWFLPSATSRIAARLLFEMPVSTELYGAQSSMALKVPKSEAAGRRSRWVCRPKLVNADGALVLDVFGGSGVMCPEFLKHVGLGARSPVRADVDT
jgi:hypothetical protein